MFLIENTSQPRRWLYWMTVSVTTLSLLTLGLPMAPASANSYGKCVQELLDAGVSDFNAANACAGALHPADVSRCVGRINRNSDISGIDVLSACSRVRRPLDLAHCVNKLVDQMDGVESLSVLEGCRRSLLPKRYAECVTGLRGKIEGANVGRLLQTCLDPQDILSQG